MDQGKITLEILRNSQISLDYDHDSRATAPITAFIITDNGIGFNDVNMNSFRTLDTQYKAGRGGRGVGRLLWLKAFNQAAIRSVFLDQQDTCWLRKFSFDLKNGIANDDLQQVQDEGTGTCVTLRPFDENYRKHAPKTTKVIANNLLAHCLWYFVPCLSG